jgi:hypothetical protein
MATLCGGSAVEVGVAVGVEVGVTLGVELGVGVEVGGGSPPVPCTRGRNTLSDNVVGSVIILHSYQDFCPAE